MRVHEGCERDRCDAQEGAAVPCLGFVRDRETRFGKGEKLVAEHVSDGRDDPRRSFLGAGAHDDGEALQTIALTERFIPFIRGADREADLTLS